MLGVLMQPGLLLRRASIAVTSVLAVALSIFAADVLVHGRGIGSGQELSCTYTSRCLPSYGNTSVCESLVVGTTERERVFRLGQPIGESGNALYFEGGADERDPVKVELDANRRAARFTCYPAE
jgi:hypothetical protein